jgi:hypothetical protein
MQRLVRSLGRMAEPRKLRRLSTAVLKRMSAREDTPRATLLGFVAGFNNAVQVEVEQRLRKRRTKEKTAELRHVDLNAVAPQLRSSVRKQRAALPTVDFNPVLTMPLAEARPRAAQKQKTYRPHARVRGVELPGDPRVFPVPDFGPDEPLSEEDDPAPAPERKQRRAPAQDEEEDDDDLSDE